MLFLDAAGSGELRFLHEFSGTLGRWEYDVAFPLNQWSHVAITYDNDSVSNNPIFYVNGEAVTSSEGSTPVGTRDSDVGTDLIIANVATGTTTWDGYLSNCALHSSILSAAQIQDHYKAGYPRYIETLAGYWPMAGDFLDHSTNSNDGTNNGSTEIDVVDRPAAWAPNTGGDVLDFDGTGDYVEVPQDATLEFGTGDFSVACWAKIEDQGGNAGLVGYGDRGGSGDGWSLYHVDSDQKIYFAIESGGTQVTMTSANAVNFGEWNHIAVSCDRSANATMYINGIEAVAASITTVGDVDHATQRTIDIGRYFFSASPVNELQGQLADVRLYSEVLAEADILALACLGTEPSDTNLELKLLLDEGTSTTANDSSANSNDGTINGTAGWITENRPPLAAAASQQTIDISGLGFTTDAFVKMLFGNQEVTASYALDEYTMSYSLGGRRLIIVRRF
jgi:hypothetical protein